MTDLSLKTPYLGEIEWHKRHKNVTKEIIFFSFIVATQVATCNAGEVSTSEIMRLELSFKA